jgi:hypothetical protein
MESCHVGNPPGQLRADYMHAGDALVRRGKKMRQGGGRGVYAMAPHASAACAAPTHKGRAVPAVPPPSAFAVGQASAVVQGGPVAGVAPIKEEWEAAVAGCCSGAHLECCCGGGPRIAHSGWHTPSCCHTSHTFTTRASVDDFSAPVCRAGISCCRLNNRRQERTVKLNVRGKGLKRYPAPR